MSFECYHQLRPCNPICHLVGLSVGRGTLQNATNPYNWAGSMHKQQYFVWKRTNKPSCIITNHATVLTPDTLRACMQFHINQINQRV